MFSVFLLGEVWRNGVRCSITDVCMCVCVCGWMWLRSSIDMTEQLFVHCDVFASCALSVHAAHHVFSAAGEFLYLYYLYFLPVVVLFLCTCQLCKKTRKLSIHFGCNDCSVFVDCDAVLTEGLPGWNLLWRECSTPWDLTRPCGH